MIKKIPTLKIFVMSLVVAHILFGFNYVCSAQTRSDAGKNKGFWSDIWSKVTSHEPVKINREGHIVPVGKALGEERKEDGKVKLLKMIRSRLDIYPEIFERMPELSALRTEETESLYFYKAPDGKIFEVSELDEKILKVLLRKIERNLNW